MRSSLRGLVGSILDINQRVTTIIAFFYKELKILREYLNSLL